LIRTDRPLSFADLATRPGRAGVASLRAAAIAALFSLAACVGGTSSMQLYPLQGEIASADPTLVIRATAKNTTGTSGPLVFRLPKRGKCEGTWSSLTPKTVSNSRGLALTWKKTGGEVGRESATVAGVNSGEIYAVCEDGTRVQGTFVVGSGTASGTGSASDTNGNVYKLLF
jgi:poly(3-hydroxybutyrate) depolymerase